MSDSPRAPLPFEPNKKPKKKSDPNAAKPSSPAKSDPASSRAANRRQRLTADDIDLTPRSVKASTKASKQPAAARSQIPEAVNRRILARMGAFSGTPSILGILVLVGSYFVITKDWFPLPSVAVLLMSMGCFGLGVVGLTYGALSASWEPENEGSPLGLTEFKTNWGRLRQEWREARAEAKSQKDADS